MNTNLLWLLVACLVMAGCRPAPDPAPTPNAVDIPDEEELPELEGEVTVEVMNWEEIEQLIGDQRGRVVVVDFWSTWCEPCKREFPNLVRLQRKYPDRITAISVNTNYVGLEDEPSPELQEEALEFLTEQGAKFPNVISNVPDEELYDQVGIVSIPAVFVYDEEGNLQKRFVNDDGEFGDEFTYEDDVNPVVESLLDGS